jgi:hypothetical protein
LREHFMTREPCFLLEPSRWQVQAGAIRDEFCAAVEDAAARANRVLHGHYDLLGYTDLTFRTPEVADSIDWHLDPVHGRRAPGGFWRGVRFLDAAAGDHKIIWELNRHQHWLALGRAAWLTGDRRYRDEFAAQLRSWMRANPPLEGINWASMLELAFRSLSWIWALHFFVVFEDDGNAPGADEAWLPELLLGLDRQLDHISRHLSAYFSPNTHLLGEALALYVAGRALPELRSADRWARLGRRILLEEATRQVHADGGHAELSLHYHRYALDFYLLALAIARRTGDPAAESFAEVATRLARFCRAMADGRGHLATIGDDDGGMLLPMTGRAPADASDSLSLAASLLLQPELAVSDAPEEVLWMLGGDRSALVRLDTVAPRIQSRMFPETGYAVLTSDRGHAILDAGPHGFLNGGHAHADALSLVLTVDGRPRLIDPGTSTYTMDPALRDRFRSSAMHNTVVIDGRPQSLPAGPFHWRTRARARIDLWRTGSGFTCVEASHDGYAPLVHRRAVLAMPDGLWMVADHILGGGRHEIDAYWHLAPDAPRPAEPAFIASTAATSRHYHGDHEGLGWCAPVYGQLLPAPTLRHSETLDLPGSLFTVIAEDPAALALEPVSLSYAGGDGWHCAGVSLATPDARILALFATPLGRDASAAPAPHRLSTEWGEMTSDARVTVLRLSLSGEPQSLLLVEGRRARWTGDAAFTIERGSPATDLHHDLAARARLSHAGAASQLG